MKGFTIIELAIVVSVIGILIVTAVISAFTFRANTELTTSTNDFIENLRSAQLKTTASEGAASYGLHLEPSRYTLFQGTDFVSRDPAYDEAHELPIRVEIASWNVGGG